MRNLFSRLMLLVVAALVIDVGLDSLGKGRGEDSVWLMGLGAASAVAFTLAGMEALVRRPVSRLLRVAERLRRGDFTARAKPAAEAVEFARLGDALNALAAAQQQRETALRDALGSADLTRAALVESEARLHLALTAADVSVYEIDVSHDRVWLDHRAAVLSRGLLPAGVWLARGDARWHRWLAGIHPADRAARAAALRALLAGTAQSLVSTYRFRDPAGGWRWVSQRGAVVSHASGGAPLRIVGVMHDVTEQFDRAAALEREVADRTVALRDSERRFRGIFDSVFQITGLLDRDGAVLELNRSALDFLGGTDADYIGRPFWDIGQWRNKKRAVAKLKERLAAAAAGDFVRHETHMFDRAGRLATFDFSLKPVRDETGAVTLLVAEARDITERAGLQAKLVQAQKMEAVGQLTGGVAHDFNNLLQALSGNLDLIQRAAETGGDARLLRLVANAQRATARGARLTQQLLAFSRRQNLRPEPVLAGDLFQEMSELLRRAAGETVTVRTLAVPDLWHCEVDAAQFESALLNLAINARDAMPDGGELTVSADNAVLNEARATALEVPPGEYVHVTVTDSGTGIAPEHLPRLFEPFFTTKEVGKGTGLGLPMVHGFVRQSGGAVSIASMPGEGTTVSLFLPRAVAPVRAESARPVLTMPLPAPRGGGINILLVEDDPEVREAMRCSLGDAGHRVLTAADGSEAVAILRDGEDLDLLLCDLMLPGDLGGLDVADTARRCRPGLRILIASGYGADAPDGFGDYEMIAKPVSHAELLHRVAAQPAAAAA